MEKTCIVCGEGFDGRADARFCTPKCRKIASRLSVTEPELSVTNKLSVTGLSVTKDKLSVTDVTDKLSVTKPIFISASDPELIKRGLEISDEKKREMAKSDLPVVSPDEPCKVPKSVKGEAYLDLEKDLHLDLRKDLGIYAWTADGIFIRPDITVDQVRRIRSLVEARHGWPHRIYNDTGIKMNVNPLCSQSV